MLGIAFHSIYQVGDQVGPSLVHIFHIGPLSCYSLLEGNKAIVCSDSPPDCSKHYKGEDDQNYNPGSVYLFHIYTFVNN